MGNPYTFPNKGTMAYQLLELTAICGEIPMPLLDRIPGSATYREAVISSLKKDRLLRTFYRDRLRGLRLGRRSKPALLSNNPKRFSFYLTGNVDTNLMKNEIPRRIRLHRIAESYVMMQNAGVSIFRDEKPQVFSPDGSPVSFLKAPAFYSSREVKELGMETVKIQGSRMTGVLLAPSGAFITYNGSPHDARWDYRSEQKAQALMQIVLCQQRLPAQYGKSQVNGLLIGSGMEPFSKLFSTADTSIRCFFLLDSSYRHFYYLTNDHYGDVLLRLLCNAEKRMELNRVLSQNLHAKKPGWTMEHDAVTLDGAPVLFAYILDIPRINRFLTALQLWGISGTLVCFDFQKEALLRHFEGCASFQTISFEKFERRFFP